MVNIKGILYANKVDAEIDDYGDLSSFSIGGLGWEARVKKEETDKESERKKYQYTGIQQIGTSFPIPYTRDQLIKKRFESGSWLNKSWFATLITLLAVAIDAVCYGLLIEQSLPDDADMRWLDLLPAVGAAIAIDLLPTFLAQNLHRVNIKRKKVITIYNIFCIILFLAFIVIILIYRFSDLNMNKGYVDGCWAILMSLIPCATTMMCFIVNYISFDPQKTKLKKLREQELYIQENIFEIKSMLEEADALPSYKMNLIEQDNALYNSAYDLIETIGEYYKSYIRAEIIPQLHSPADTTDLSATRNVQSVQKIQLPII